MGWSQESSIYFLNDTRPRPFKTGELVIWEEKFETYKILLFIKNIGDKRCECIDKNLTTNLYETKEIPIDLLYHYSELETIKQDGKLVMGAGIAKQFAAKWPLLPEKWGKRIKSRPYVLVSNGYPCLVGSPTKIDWKNDSPIWLIERSAKQLVIIEKYIIFSKARTDSMPVAPDKLRAGCAYFGDRT